MGFWGKLLNVLKLLLNGGTMSTEDMAKDIVNGVVKAAEHAPAELEALVTDETRKFLADASADAATLGLDYVKALVFGQAVQIVQLASPLTDEQVGALSVEELLRREVILAAHAKQMAAIAAAEAAHQAAALALRERAKAFVDTILQKVGQLGLGILTAGLLK